jgi:hypothetical protein
MFLLIALVDRRTNVIVTQVRSCDTDGEHSV